MPRDYERVKVRCPACGRTFKLAITRDDVREVDCFKCGSRVVVARGLSVVVARTPGQGVYSVSVG